jgi:hypothetical protein
MMEQTNYDMQADAAEFNARMSDLSARYARESGRHEITRLGLQYGQLQGKQRAGLAASGVDLSVGSAAEVQASSDVLKNIDMNTLEVNAIKKAWGFQVQAMNYRNQAAMARITRNSIDPRLAYSATLLTGLPGVTQSFMGAFNALGNVNWSSLGGGTQKPAPVDDRTINYLPSGGYFGGLRI